MAISGTDLALTTCRLGAARVGAFRLGFAPCFVKGVGAVEPGEYGWDEIQPPSTQWTLLTEDCVCGKRPVASFTDVPDPSDEAESVQFTDTSTPSETITYWHWDFGDGSESYDENPTHAYATAGTYTVTLSVASPNGSDTVTGTHTVETVLPVAEFTSLAVEGGIIGEGIIAFTDATTGGTAPYTYAWDFGDGVGTSTDQNPQYTFVQGGGPNPQTFTVVLTVTDDAAQVDGVSHDVQVTFNT